MADLFEAADTTPAGEAVVRLVPPAPALVPGQFSGFVADSSPDGARVIAAWVTQQPAIKSVVEQMRRCNYGVMAHFRRKGAEGGFSVLAGTVEQLHAIGLDTLLAPVAAEIDWTRPIAYGVSRGAQQSMEECLSAFHPRTATQASR